MARTFSRRDVLKASSALALTFPAASVRAAAPPPTAITPELIAAAQKEGKVVYYTSIDLPLAEKIAKAFEAKYSGIAVRVERTGAERVFQRIGQEYGSRIYAVDVVNSSDAAHFIAWKRDGILAALRAGGRGEALSRRAQGCGRAVRQLPRRHERDRLQHQPGEGRGRAEELRRSARSEMVGQDGQGASGLQRQRHERDVPAHARSRLGVSGEARQAEDHAGAVLDRSAEEARARRARRDGGRQRIQRAAAEGRGPADRDRLSGRGHADGGRAECDLQERAEPERGAAVEQLHVHAGMPAARHRCRRAALGPSGRERACRGASRSRTSRS